MTARQQPASSAQPVAPEPGIAVINQETRYMNILIKGSEQILTFVEDPSQAQACLEILKNLLITMRAATNILENTQFEQRTLRISPSISAVADPASRNAYLAVDAAKYVARTAYNHLLSRIDPLLVFHTNLAGRVELDFKTLSDGGITTLADLANLDNPNSPFTQAMKGLEALGFKALASPPGPAAATPAPV